MFKNLHKDKLIIALP